MGRSELPSKAELGRIAENRPDLLNALVAYFVMEWHSVILTEPPHGVDQLGITRLLPDYVETWGVDCCLHHLLDPHCPVQRFQDDPGFVSRWLADLEAAG